MAKIEGNMMGAISAYTSRALELNLFLVELVLINLQF